MAAEPKGSHTEQASEAGAASPRRRIATGVGLAVGVLLLVAAVAFVFAQRSVVLDAIGKIGTPSAGPVVVLLSCVAGNILLTGLLYSLLIARFGRVGRMEMQALIASTTLVNYLPLRPGLPGRLAYHRLVNRIAVADSARVVVHAIVLSATVALGLAAALAVAASTGWPLWVLVSPPAMLLGLAGCVGTVRVWAWGGLLRLLDMGLWAARYHAAFALLGSPIDVEVALAMACISTVATMIPFVSNGLGLREWAVGLAAPLLTSYQVELGITAELVNRAAELLVILPAGLIGAAWLGKRRRAARSLRHGSDTDS